MNWLDFLFLIILCYSVFKGFKIGFVLGLSRILGLTVGLFVAFSYCRNLAKYVGEDLGWAAKLGPFFESLIRLPIQVSGASVGEFLQERLDILSSLQIPVEWPVFIGRLLDMLKQSGDDLEKVLGGIMTFTFLDVLAFIVLLFVVERLLIFSGFLLSKALAYSFMGPLDKMGGALLGFVRGVVFVVIILTLMVPLQVMGSIVSGDEVGGGLLSDTLSSSYTVSYLKGIVDYLSIYLLHIPQEVLTPTKSI